MLTLPPAPVEAVVFVRFDARGIRRAVVEVEGFAEAEVDPTLTAVDERLRFLTGRATGTSTGSAGASTAMASLSSSQVSPLAGSSEPSSCLLSLPIDARVRYALLVPELTCVAVTGFAAAIFDVPAAVAAPVPALFFEPFVTSVKAVRVRVTAAVPAFDPFVCSHASCRSKMVKYRTKTNATGARRREGTGTKTMRNGSVSMVRRIVQGIEWPC